VAGSAAYYSVFGLSSLFAGARFEVIIMAAALEVAKLVTASYLHNNWKKAGWMKWYLSLAVVILMVITSLGIYGFLTSAYQTTADQLGVIEKQVKVIELKKDRFQEQLDYYNIEKSNLTESILDLRNGISNNKIQYTDTLGRIITTQSSSTRKLLTRELETAVESRANINVKLEQLTDSITKLELQVLDIESNNEVAAEIGPLRYMAELTEKPMNVIVNWFTLLIVFVFDPLAIAMVIALNKLIGRHDDNDTGNIISDGDGDTPSDSNFSEPIIEEDGEGVSEPKENVDDNRTTETELEQEEIQEVLEEVEQAPERIRENGNQEVKVVPKKDTKKLYNEKPKHTYQALSKVPTTKVTRQR
tara:strand:- start:3735 stop:4814 length:1080 start_codon:yes stop_codon:yes gene_type:complete